MLDLKHWDIAHFEHYPNQVDVILHLAAIPRPTDAAPDVLYSNNVAATHGLLEYAVKFGVKKVVFASSEAVLGVAYSNDPTRVKFLPIDEQHPIAPADPYSLSKATGECLCEAYAMRNPSLSITTLRFAWVLCPETYGTKLLRAQNETSYGLTKLFSYSDIRDVSQACMLAVQSTHAGHEVFFIAAPDTICTDSTTQLCEHHFPQAESRFSAQSRMDSLLNCEKARSALGYSPTHSWRDE